MNYDGGMTISKGSWHYRWYMSWIVSGKVKWGVSENLCRYMRGVIVGLMMGVITWIGDHSPRTIKRTLPYLAVLGVLAVWSWNITYLVMKYGWLKVLLVGCSMVAGAFVVVVLLVLVIVIAMAWADNRPLPSIRESSTAQLIGGWIVARKRRICPYIEFVD